MHLGNVDKTKTEILEQVESGRRKQQNRKSNILARKISEKGTVTLVEGRNLLQKQ